MRTRVALGAFLAALAAAPAGTGAAPTRAAWAAAATKVCAAANAHVRGLPSPTTTQRLIADLRALVPVARAEAAKLATIPAPRADAPAVARLVSTLRAENRLVEQQLIPALVRGDEGKAELIVAQVTRLGSRSDAIARALGARACAETPTPEGP